MGLAGCGAARLKSQSAEALAACYRIGAVIHSLPSGVAPARELGSASYGFAGDRLGCFELGPLLEHGVHDDGEPSGECDARLSHGGVPSENYIRA